MKAGCEFCKKTLEEEFEFFQKDLLGDRNVTVGFECPKCQTHWKMELEYNPSPANRKLLDKKKK